jgi:radical SAM/Cys-rich protein
MERDIMSKLQDCQEAKVFRDFNETLGEHGLELKREEATTLQINLGTLCNQTCRHCHLEAGPYEKEIMDEKTIYEVMKFAKRGKFKVADITGGAPELHPQIVSIVEELSGLVPKVMIRSNLTALASVPHEDRLLEVLRTNCVAIVASLPSLSPSQTNAQRGKGVQERSIEVLRRLNELGYGLDGSSLELNLVSNPVGAFLPQRQNQAEKRFKAELQRRHGITFNRLYTLTNVPLGRFKRWLRESGNYDAYMERLYRSFNPCTIEGLMCRTLVSVSWDGYLYDCDFNLACGIPMAWSKKHVSEAEGSPPPGTPIATGNHCYACTAGSGFT